MPTKKERPSQDTNSTRSDKAIWQCKIGEIDRSRLPNKSDGPMRKAVEEAYFALTGEYPEFMFTGWGAGLTEEERFVADWKQP